MSTSSLIINGFTMITNSRISFVKMKDYMKVQEFKQYPSCNCTETVTS